MKNVIISEKKNGRINELEVLMVRTNFWSEVIQKYGEWSEVGMLEIEVCKLLQLLIMI